VPESWVINASPIILLAKVGLIQHVPQLVETLVIPQPVVEEILSFRDKDAAAIFLEEAGQKFIQPAVAELKHLSSSGIGSGERAVISFATAHSGFIAVLDDLEARMIVHRLGIKTLGTVGVVLRLKKAGLISEAKSYLQQIRKVGGYMSDELFREALRQVGEQS
jgi:predicted nucleic acid-binding protein